MVIHNESFPDMPMIVPVDGHVYSGTFELEGNKIHFHNENGTDTAEIISQTATVLVMKMQTSTSYSFYGIESVTEIDGDFTLTR